MKAIWKFLFYDLGNDSPPGDLLYSNVAGVAGYTRKILNFNGINIHCDITSKALPTVTTSFEIENINKEFEASNFIDGYVLIRVQNEILPSGLDRSWKLKINSAIFSYGTIKIQCASDMLTLEGSKFPPYPSLRAIAPEVKIAPENRCVPFIIGKAYIPIYPILYNKTRRYLLGKTVDVTGDFTIHNVRSPREYPTVSFWDNTYTYNQSDVFLNYSSNQYKITDMIIATSTTGGAVDSNGIFQTGGALLSPLVQYQGDEASKNPGAFIKEIIEKAGITNCNSSSFTNADSTFFSDINWSGGFWEFQDFEGLLSSALAQCDCFLSIDDEINFNAFDSSPVETFKKSMIIENSFNISPIRKPQYDGGLVRWRWEDSPEDILSAEHPAGLTSNINSGIIPTNPDTDAFEYRYETDNTMYNALKFGILHFQKKHSKTAQINFISKLDKIDTYNTIIPGMVIEIDDDTSSGSLNIVEAYDQLKILLYEIHIRPDCTIELNGYSYDLLNDYFNVNTYAVEAEEDDDIDIIIEEEEDEPSIDIEGTDDDIEPGDPLVLNPDGTISLFLIVTQSIGTAAVFESASTNYISCCYDSNAQKIVVAYQDTGNSNKGTAVVGTVSGTSISFGTPVVFEQGATKFTSCCYDANAQKVVITYEDDDNSDYGTAIVGTVSGTSISFGTTCVFNEGSTEYTSCCYDPVNQKIVVFFRDSGNAGYITSIIGTVSGSSIGFCTEHVVDFANATYIKCCYDVSASKVVVAYRNSLNSFSGTAIVGTVSGTSISFGTPVVFQSGSTNYISCCYDSNAQKVVIAYRENYSTGYGMAIVGDVSGSAISFGTAITFKAESTTWTTCTYDELSQKVVIGYQGKSSTYYGTAITGTVDEDSISFDDSAVFESANTSYIVSCYDSDEGKIVFSYIDAGNSGYGTSIVFQSGSSTYNNTNFIGFSMGSYSQGDIVEVATAGSTDSNQTGLIPGEAYYIQNDGSLSTTPDDPEVFAGTALSSTTILIKQ